MPEITLLGWFHTVIGITALASGFYTLVKRKEITLQFRAGQIYLVATLITALSALGIFQHGNFGAAHGLAILTLIGLLIGTLAATTGIFGKFSRYVQAAGYSATLLFHIEIFFSGTRLFTKLQHLYALRYLKNEHGII